MNQQQRMQRIAGNDRLRHAFATEPIVKQALMYYIKGESSWDDAMSAAIISLIEAKKVYYDIATQEIDRPVEDLCRKMIMEEARCREETPPTAATGTPEEKLNA